MAVEVIMPALGLAQETGRLLRWIKQEGEEVARGDPLMEIETDKSTVEIEAPGKGVLSGVRVQAGEEVEVGTGMAWLLAPGESLPAPEPTRDASAPATPAPQVSSPEKASPAPAAGKDGHQQARVAASPLARRLARESGVVLRPGGGGGPQGAYLAADLANPPAAGRGMDSGRRRMAIHSTQVWTTTPHFYLGRDVRARRLRDWREALRQRSGQPVTVTDLLLRTVGAALRVHPEMSDYWKDGEIHHREGVAVGLAIATTRGLLLATLRDPDRLGVTGLVAARGEMVRRAQAGKLAGADLEPASITISNLGMFGVDHFQAILTEGQSSLLAVGRIRDQVIPVDGQPAVEPVLSLSLTCDHRVLDGALAAPFLAALVEYLEEPALLLDLGSVS